MSTGSQLTVGRYPARARGFLVLRLDHSSANAHLVRSTDQPGLTLAWTTLCRTKIPFAKVGTCDASRRLCARCHYIAEGEVTPERSKAEDLRRGHVINADNGWFELLHDPVSRGGYFEVMGRRTSGTERRLFLTRGRPGYLRRPMLIPPTGV